MSTSATTPNVSDNPFDTPLPSEVHEHQQASAATVAAGGNPFDDPLPSEKAEAATAPKSKNFDVGAALGGMHGGSYDIAFRNPQGQISPDTIKAEAIGGTTGVAADAVGAIAPELASTYGKAAVAAVAKMAAEHPFAASIIKHVLTTGASALGGGYTAAHILKALGVGGK